MSNRDFKLTALSGLITTIISSVICFFIKPICCIVCVILGISLSVVFCIYTKRRYDKLNELNDYLTLVCAGNYDLDIGSNSEGELSILKNNLYKVISILKTQNEMLAKDKTNLSDSLADISHQLKTPMTSMMVMTDLLKIEQNESKRAEFISIIESQLDKMKWLITNLLKISKLDAGTIILKKEPYSSVEIINEAVKPFEIMLDIKDIALQNNAEAFELNVDKSWTVEAIENIIKNCIEHTDAGGKITITGEDTNIYSTIRIEDNGCGILKEDLPHIFERFYHGSNSDEESVGIGLALSKAILEKENAEISVESEKGNGSQFTIKFYKSII